MGALLVTVGEHSSGWARGRRQPTNCPVPTRQGRDRCSITEWTMQNAFLRAAGNPLADVDAAWKLADRACLTVVDDGSVDGVDEVLAQVIEK